MINKNDIRIDIEFDKEDLPKWARSEYEYNGETYKLFEDMEGISKADIERVKDILIEGFIDKIKEGERGKQLITDTVEGKIKLIPEEEARENWYIDKIFRQGAKTEEQEQLIDIYYLKREPIKVKYNITNSIIDVSNEHTNYINISPYREINIDELLQKRMEIIRFARVNKVKISYANKTKDRIENNKIEYEKDMLLSKELYRQLKDRWETIRDIRGLHSGTINDQFLEDTTKISWKFNELGYRSRAIGIIQDVAHSIQKLHDDIFKWEQNIIKIYI